MIHIAKIIASHLRATLVVVVVLVGLIVGAARVLFPQVDEYREHLAAELSERIGMPVRIEKLAARLSGLVPELALDGLELLNPKSGQVRLRVGEVRFRLDPLASMRDRAVRVGQVTVSGVRLMMRRDRHGQVGMAGYTTLEAAVDVDTMTPELLLTEGAIRLEDGEIYWENRLLGLPPLFLSQVNGRILNVGGRHQLDVSAVVPGTADRVDIKADLYGDPARPLDWRGDVYLKSEQVQLAKIHEFIAADALAVKGLADLEIWSRWENGRLSTAQGKVRVRDLLLENGTAPALAWGETSATLAVQEQGGGWRLDLRDLMLADGQTLDLALYAARDDDASLSLRAAVSRFLLQDLAALAPHFLSNETLQRLIDTLQPRGALENLRLKLEIPADGEPTWQTAGRIAGLRIEPWADAPGIRKLDVGFHADATHGRLELAGDDVEFRFTELFRWPWLENRVAGNLDWRIKPDGGVEMQTHDIRLENPDIRTRSRLRLSFDPGKSAPFVDLQTDYRNADGSATSKYLPVGIMSDELVAWLDTAIVSGHVPSGSFIFRGPADRFPFYQRDGRFQVLFGTEKTILDYQPGWPRLEEIVAEVQFLDEGLGIELVEGKLLSSDVTQASMQLPDLDDARRVFIKGRVRGPFSDAFRVLRETPLGERQGRYIQGMRAKGRSVVDLDLAIPVEDGEDYRINGRLSWNKAGLLLDDFDLALTDLKGTLRFNTEGVYAENLLARLWGDPLRLNMDTLSEAGGGDSRTRIDVDLDLDPQRLARQYPHWLWRDLKGPARARLLLDLEHGEHNGQGLPLSYRLESTLAGVAVTLPEPLSKTASQVRPLFLSGELPLTADSRIQAGYGDIMASFQFGRSEDGEPALQAGTVQCGVERVPEAGRKGFQLTGRLRKVDLAAWGEWLAAGEFKLDGERNGNRSPSKRVGLFIEELLLPGWSVTGVNLDMVRTPNAWEAELDSRQLSGSIRIPDDIRNVPVSAQLKRLRLETASGKDDSPKDSVSGADPRRAPGLFVDVEQLYVDERPIGSLKLKAVPVPSGLSIEQIELQGPLMSLKGSGDWLDTAEGQRTRLDLHGESPDLGQALQELQFTPPLSGGATQVSASLQWSDSPTSVSLAKLDGDMQFHIGKGRVLEVDPGVGRLFGLFNLGALSRRLTLDFSDFFGVGYAFDRINGHFKLRDGDAHSKKFSVAGPSVDMDISGRIGLVNEDYDQLVTVTPEVSTALPVAGVIAGGPVVGAALLVAQRIMGKEMNKLARFQYQVSGPWDAPNIERLEKQDTRSRDVLPGDSGSTAISDFIH